MDYNRCMQVCHKQTRGGIFSLGKGGMFSSKCNYLRIFLLYFLRFIKIGTLDWARPFPADASSMSRANKGPDSSALPWPMAYRPWALAELTRRRPFVDTGRPRRHLQETSERPSHHRLWWSVPTFLKRRKYCMIILCALPPIISPRQSFMVKSFCTPVLAW